MYKTCPKCGHARAANDQSDPGVCPGCGLIFEKWLKGRFRREAEHASPGNRSSRGRGAHSLARGWWRALAEAAMAVQAPVNPVLFYSRCLLYCLFVVWGISFIWMEYYLMVGTHRHDHLVPEIGGSFMHSINLVFHEAGHVLFQPFGRFMTVLGGSLMQVLVPLIVAGTFLIRERDPFAASIGLWWVGQSLMDVAPYINDARNGQIMLLGGVTGAETSGYHDWETLLTMMGSLHLDHAIADTVDLCGEALMLLSFAWGAGVLHKQFRTLR